MTIANRIALIAPLTLALAACGSGEPNQVTRGADGMPKGDTGWTMNRDGDTLVLQRQNDQLTLSYTIAGKQSGAEGTISAKAAPCLGGRGEQTASQTFTSMEYSDAGAISELRDQFDSVVATIDDRCDIPEEISGTIVEGFDGLYFRSASDRAEFLGQ